MRQRRWSYAVVFLGVISAGLSADALSGSGDSTVGALETVRPVLTGIMVPTSSSVEATFSEPMRATGLDVPGNYVLSGAGAGTLGANPGSASGAGPVTLTWSTGEGLGGEPLALTVTGVQDALGNPINASANTAAGSGVGVAPVFSGLTVTPSSAAAGETVSISFTSSEDLNGDAEVAVNGNPATRTAKAAFTHEYTVLSGDPIGPVAIEISGFDLAGNIGSLITPGALQVIAPASELPLRAWPVAVALLVAGVLALAFRRRLSCALLVPALLASSTAFAADPVVSNVAFTQQPTPTGTEVVIGYDLDSPNGPSDITVSLSKDGGVDGFAFPVTSVTGDLTSVSSGTGYTIIWNIAADYPNEDIPSAQLRVTAEDGLLIVPPELISIPAGGFNMGNSGVGDDFDNPFPDELPVHTVMLSAYEIGKYEVTNQQYCDVLNYAFDSSRNYLRTSGNAVWAGSGDIYAGGNLQKILGFAGANCNIEFSAGSFSPKTRVGLPGSTNYSMGTHPVQSVTWFGAVSFANWLSEMEGLTAVYDASTAGWPANLANNGYHLPTEAQWERAAAWDGTKHWIYGFTADTLTGSARANYHDNDRVNPLGLTFGAYTSPVGWFDGVNVSPNGSASTTNSVSPVGAYDMSGNVFEWCQDWYLNTYYSTSPGTDPQGAASGSSRVVRGGTWDSSSSTCRSARRQSFAPDSVDSNFGFRLARGISRSLNYSAGPGGGLSGNAAQTVPPGGDGTPVTAVPDSGFAFVDWSDGSTDNPRTDTNVAQGISVTANFLELPEMISVPAGSFDMGRTSSGDDATFGSSAELPVHTVTLSAYEIGRIEVTNQQVCDVFNWADDQGFFTTVDATTATAFGQELLDLDSSFGHIEYVGGVFQPETRTGLPGATTYAMADHPAQEISWYGAAAFCNWLSMLAGLTPVYDTSTWAANFANDGYRLPTEAQWERAAAWDGSKHWIYSFTSDTLTGKDRANYADADPDRVNPLGLTSFPYTSPPGWFDGNNVSPNGSISTQDSLSPIGAYDMSGNVWEWCHDWYDSGYYAISPTNDPEGPASGTNRVLRGGSYNTSAADSRSAFRSNTAPTGSSSGIGFRLAR